MEEVYADAVADRNAPAALKRVSWGAIIAGVVAVLAIQILLSLLGIGIGAVAFDPTQDRPSSFGIGAAIWWVISGLIALFVGGYIAGRLAGIPRRGDGMVHGFLTWSLATLVTFYLLTTTVGALVGGTASSLKQTVAGAAQGAIQTGQGQQQPSVVELATDPEVQQLAQTAFDDGRLDDNERTQIANLIAQKNNISQEQAREQVANYEQTYMKAQQQYQAAKAKVQQTVQQRGDQAQAGITGAALGTFVMLLLGAGAATFGGGTGAPKRGVAGAREIRKAA
ncbi:MAG TPA: hypothetical protein VD837_11335 [Terriglobales bacterium]|nr:hypothetical protein [Terriglobales bacterium]